MRLWDLLQHLDHHAAHMDFNDGCEHIIKVLKTPLVGSEAYVRTARFAVLWRLKNSVEYDSQNRPIFDQVTGRFCMCRLRTIAFVFGYCAAFFA